MRMCFFSTACTLQGGAERCQAVIVRHVLERGGEAHVVLREGGELAEHYESLGARVHVMYWAYLQKLTDPAGVLRYLVGLPGLVFRLARLLRRERIDLLHVNEILDFPGLIAARLVGIPSAVFCRVVFRVAAGRRVLALLGTALANRVVCVSHAVHRMALYGWRRAKIRVIHDGGPDYERFDPDRVRPIRPPGTEGALVIGLVAKLVWAKGHMKLLDLAEKLRGCGYRNLQYVIVGGTVPGHEAYEAELRRQVDARGLGEIVHLVGRRADVSGWLAGMDIVCHLPLNEDPFPGVPMEAAAMRKPVLSFVSGGVPEQLTHPTSARLVPIGDVDALVPHAVELIENPGLRREMGDNARAEVRSKVSLKEHLAAVDSLYQELAGRGN